jgi:hypothetical protein
MHLPMSRRRIVATAGLSGLLAAVRPPWLAAPVEFAERACAGFGPVE